MLDPTLPAVVIRDAWSRIRLTHIQKAVESTILELEGVAKNEALVGLFDKEDPERMAAHAEALTFCVAELRREVGLETALPSDQEKQTGAQYSEFLLLFRHAAAEGLRSRLGVSPALIDPPSREDQGAPGGLRALLGS